MVAAVFLLTGIFTGLLLAAAWKMLFTSKQHLPDALQKSGLLIDNALNSQEDTFFIFEPETGKAIHWNSTFTKVSGYSGEEIANLPAPSSFYSPEDLEKANAFLKEIATNKKGIIELNLICKDGSKIPTEYNVSIVNDIQRDKTYLISIGRDISERKRAERKINDQANRMQLALQAARMGTWEWDLINNHVEWSPETLKIFGTTAEKFGGTYEAYASFAAPEDLAAVNSGVKAFLANAENESIIQYDHKIVRGDGSTGWIEVRGTLFLDEKKNPVRMTGICTDISEQKEMEARLRQAEKMESIGTLAGGIAHDFNNMLAAILGYSDMVLEELPEGSQAWANQKAVVKAGNRAKELVKQILTFSRKGPETQQPVQPYLVIQEALKLMRASMPTTIEIQEEIDSDCGSIIANPTNIHQVLVNLCTNALHAMEYEQGVISITLKKVELNVADIISETGVAAGTFVELMVSDTGHGMNKKTVERIFEPYFSTKEVGKGSGMGLAMVHGIIQSCKGFIKVDSRPGKGSTFRVYFPSLVEEKTAEADEGQREPLPIGHERILAVDDEESIVGMYKATLERQGYSVTAHRSSEKTLEVFQASPDNFDLIITDQTMPHLPGSELAKKILQVRPNIPIILCTGYSSMISEEKAKEIGIDRFVMKPVSRRDLAITVREVLDKSRS